MKKTEKQVQNEIMCALSRPPWSLVFRNNVGKANMGRGNWVAYGVGGEGGSDLICCVRGRFVAIECKSATGRLSLKQQNFLKAINNAGGISFVARSAEEALHLLEEGMNNERDPDHA